MTDQEKYPTIAKVTLVNEQTILEMIEDSKNHAIKHILRAVEGHMDEDSKEYKQVRGVILDELNDVSREFKSTLEKILKE